jgi:hypothetical protein
VKPDCGAVDRLKSQYTYTNLPRIAPHTTVFFFRVNTFNFTIIFVIGKMYDVEENRHRDVRWYCDGVEWP